ncbi:hypothetical protein APHAL10511_003283 [Amanita phalloides]|nr:hypothetical protein APHAL10511_003283 [Amanita phalloides]
MADQSPQPPANPVGEPAPSTDPAISSSSSFIPTLVSALGSVSASISASMSTAAYPPTLDIILAQIAATTNTRASLVSLSNTFRNGLPKESREAILGGILPGGQDPLGTLDARHHTLGVLWILSARLTLLDAAPPVPAYVAHFCHYFDPEQARMAPDRVTLLAKGIARYAVRMNHDAWAIEPLYDLVTRYPPDGSYLTTIHPLFVLTCVTTRHFTIALPVLQAPISNIDTTLSNLTYLDNLKYHYVGGIALAALTRWDEAEAFFEICVGSPAVTLGLPRYVHPALSRALKNTPYQAFVGAYPRKMEVLQEIMNENQRLFAAEKNLGLVVQAFRRAPRWTLKKLTSTYLTLGLGDIAKAIKIESEAEVRNLLLSMIEAKDISARITPDGTVTFFDATPQYTKQDLNNLLQDVQNQSEHLRHLEREMGRDKEYLKKALKQKDESVWVGPLDDDLFAGSGSGRGSGTGWIDEPMYVEAAL